VVRQSAGPADPAAGIGRTGTEALAEPARRPTPRSGGTPRVIFKTNWEGGAKLISYLFMLAE
jgi:hypothetical protein